MENNGTDAWFMSNTNNIHEKLNYFVFLLHPKKTLICAKRTSYKLAVWLFSDNDCAINNRDSFPTFQSPSSMGIVEKEESSLEC